MKFYKRLLAFIKSGINKKVAFKMQFTPFKFYEMDPW